MTDADLDKKAKVFGESTEGFKAAITKAQKWGKDYARPEDIPDDKIP